MTAVQKPSGLGWAPKVPAHWSVQRIKHVARLESGHTPDRSNPEYWRDSNDIPWVSLSDTKWLAENNYISDTALYVNQLGLANSSAHMLPARVVVFTRDATIGKAAITTRPMAVSQHIIAWVCGPSMNPEYLLYVFYAMEEELTRYTMGATLRTIGMPDVKKLKTPVPPLAEQRAIADFLDRRTAAIDALIEKKELLLELHAEKRQALVDETATGGEPQRPTSTSAASWMPRTPTGWLVRRLKHLGQIRSGIAKNTTGTSDTRTLRRPYVRVANVQNGFLNLEEMAELDVTPEEARRFALRSGDVLMNEGGDFDKLGRGYVWEGQVPGCLHQNHVFAFRPGPGADPYWINLATQATYLRHFFTLRSKQSTNLASISASNLGEAPILLPPARVQAEALVTLRSALASLDSSVAAISNQLGLLHEYRQALITAAVTGQLDVTKEAA